ncbi:MAG TPA: hypothetical protein VFW93_15625 [Aquabacterium sp.]|uniref:hypothetical protein n=1 Tax=Aquabacterium sp. TaxID=1872578 RepID=UPI002E3529FA|nr:hypothetical protein [Aquabacterium sp.]HEX5357641.1 hypothetical protein [Aquabacterium sp.]
MITLLQTPYDINAQNDLVRTTLLTKKISQSHPGIGPHSCWAGIAFYQNGEIKIQTGFSQMKNELEQSPYKNSWVKYHGELAGLAQAIEVIMGNGHQSGQLFPIVGVYIEMSPCGKCGPALQNLLPDGTTVLYSFDYATQKAAWEKAATDLCKA